MIYDLTVTQFVKVLKNLDHFLDKAQGYADHKKFDVEILMTSRLAPDQFHFIKQIQIACDAAEAGVKRLMGQNPAASENKEQNLADVRARIKNTISFLQTVKEADVDNSKNIKISQPRWEGKTMNGYDYIIQHMIPNFYFHITTAYAILRHNGVDLGKKDYLGDLPYIK